MYKDTTSLNCLRVELEFSNVFCVLYLLALPLPRIELPLHLVVLLNLIDVAASV